MVTDGLEVKQDVQTSADPKGTSVTTFTEEQVIERERKVRSDALAEAGRFKAEAQKASEAAQKALDRLNKMEKERIEAELEAHRDDPAEIRRIRSEQQAREATDKAEQLERELTEHKARLSQLEAERNTASLSQNVRDIATATGVDPEKLLKYAKVTDGSKAAIEEVAKDLPKSSPKNNLRPDSNRSLGGTLTDDQVVADYIKNPYDPAVKQRHDELVRRRGY